MFHDMMMSLIVIEGFGRLHKGTCGRACPARSNLYTGPSFATVMNRAASRGRVAKDEPALPLKCALI